MKTLLIATSVAVLLAGPAFAGRIGVFVNTGGYGCAPRYYTPPVCYTPRVVNYCPPVTYFRSAPVTYFRSAPVAFYSSPAVVIAPVRRTVYRAPLVTSGVTVAPVSFGWRR